MYKRQIEDQTDALLAALVAGQLHAALIGLGRYDRRILLVWRPATSPPAGRAFLTLARQHLTPPPGST